MLADRLDLYRQIESDRKSKVLVYISGDRPGLETQIHAEVLDFFAAHLDTFNLPDKISLILYSRGGNTLAGWSLANLIRQFCKNFEVIIPSKAHSTATLIALAANVIMMTKQATLGPIDPSVNSPLNPPVPGAAPTSRLPISVEEVVGYLELAKNQGAIKGEEAMTQVFLKLADNVHPLALGGVFRARTQIQMLAKRLLKQHMTSDADIEKVVAFVCSESGSHDYTISRREAREQLKLPIEKPAQKFYDSILKPLYNDLVTELELHQRFDPNLFLATVKNRSYSFRRCLIESITGGQHYFVSEGTLTKIQSQTPEGQILTNLQENRLFEGWKYDPPAKPHGSTS